MRISLVLNVGLLSLLVEAKDKNNQQTGSFIQDNLGAITLGILVVALIVFLYKDKKNGYQYSRALRGKIGDIIYSLSSRRSKSRSELRQKIQTEQPQTPKVNGFDHQKTYIQAYPEQLAQENQLSPKEQQVLPEQIEPQTPQANFKDVFAVKQSKSKHKINKKSKSKLKNRLLGKGSDGEEQQENNSFVADELVQQNSLSLENDGELNTQ